MEATFGGAIGGMIVGALIGVVAEPLLSAMAGAARPVAKEVVKGGLILVAATSELVDGLQKEWSSIVTEATAELETASSK